MKQTAVEWLVKKIELTDFWIEEIQQALEMEKLQIIDTYDRGYDIGAYGDVCEPEKYYNETFKK